MAVDFARLDGLRQPNNRSVSTLDVTVYRSDIRDYVVIDDTPNTGMSITNGVHYFLPVIVNHFSLDPKRCVFIEKYPADAMRPDPSYSKIVIDEWRVSTWRRALGMKAEYLLGVVRWRPVPLGLAKQLQAAGEAMTEAIGSTLPVTIRGKTQTVKIVGYDGHSYHYEMREPPGQGVLSPTSMTRQLVSAIAEIRESGGISA